VRKPIAGAILGGLLVTVPLAAQDHPAVERGFAADKVYQLADVDNVAIMNGNVTVRIPIGGAYPAGGPLRYALTLVYNSKLWDFEEILVGNSTSWCVRCRPTTRRQAWAGPSRWAA